MFKLFVLTLPLAAALFALTSMPASAQGGAKAAESRESKSAAKPAAALGAASKAARAAKSPPAPPVWDPSKPLPGAVILPPADPYDAHQHH